MAVGVIAEGRGRRAGLRPRIGGGDARLLRRVKQHIGVGGGNRGDGG